MELSPKAVRFLIEAVEHYQTYHEERLQDAHLTEEEVAALTNDHQYLEALKTDLKHYHNALTCKGSSLIKGGGMDIAQANKATTLADLFAGRVGRIRSGGKERLSEDCGEKFTDCPGEKRRPGYL